MLYRVRWKNYCSDDDTWEPEAHLEDCREVLLSFKKTLAEAKAKKEADAKKTPVSLCGHIGSRLHGFFKCIILFWCCHLPTSVGNPFGIYTPKETLSTYGAPPVFIFNLVYILLLLTFRNSNTRGGRICLQTCAGVGKYGI